MTKAKDVKVKQLLGSLEDEMEFYFSSFFGSSYPSIYRKELCWKPPTDVYETKDHFVVTLELAQMKAEEVSITFQDETLFVRGIRKAVPPCEQRRYHKMEIHYGPFEQRIPISASVEVENLTAQYKDGFLEIRLPKSPLANIESIDIEVE
jgi:HSP20 family protein